MICDLFCGQGGGQTGISCVCGIAVHNHGHLLFIYMEASTGGNLMTISEVSALSCYREIGEISADHGVFLVQHTGTGIVYVKKILTVYNAEVYRYLMDHHVKGTPVIFDIQEADGRLIVIEEYISGHTLRDILDRGHLFFESDAVDIVDQLCRILQELHSASPPVLHRDIKPSNIILTADGSIRLLDMNAARRMTPGKAQDTQLIGTVGYAAPEQYGFGTSSIQTDIYSTGVLLCELVTGHLPNAGIPGGKIGRIVRKCTRIDPADRYLDMADLRNAFSALIKRPAVDLSMTAGNSSGFRYTLPGFRSGNPIHYIIAGFAYFALLCLSLTYTAEGFPPGPVLWTERFIYLICGFCILLFTGNYLDVWRPLRIRRIRNVFVRLAVVLAIDVFLAAVMMTFMIFAAVVLKPLLS